MSRNLLEALRLLGVYTAGRFDFQLWGQSKASCRAHIMSALKGCRVPQSAAGINALRSDLLALSGIVGTCIADTEDKFSEWAREAVAHE